MADHDRPGQAAGRLVAVARDLGAIQAAGRAALGERGQDPGQGRPDPRRDLGQGFAAGRPGLGRRPAPGRQRVPVAGPDLVAVEALPLALADLEEAGFRARDRGGEHRRPAIASAVWAVRRSGEWTSSRSGPSGSGRAGASCGWASRSATSAAWRSPVADSGVSAWPWKRPSTMNSDSP